VSDILIYVEEMKRTRHSVITLYAKHYGRSYEEAERALDRDHFMSVDEAVEWGLIDKVLRGR
jgi:ATP-dependent Clp protease protease subunit